MARMTAKERAAALLAAVSVIETLVKALAAGKVPPPVLDRVRKSDVRYAPYFAVGRGAREKGTVPYNAKWLEQVIIADSKHSKWLRVALQICEGKELGYVDSYVLWAIQNCRPGYDLASLERGLKMKSKEYATLHGAEIALGILQ